jgi:hypothetical protein
MVDTINHYVTAMGQLCRLLAHFEAAGIDVVQSHDTNLGDGDRHVSAGARGAVLDRGGYSKYSGVVGAEKALQYVITIQYVHRRVHLRSIARLRS